ncbi:MAG: hypothetical protein QOE62_169, partial [Actinomycetota bacterium]|nr:hypothetical protein [Actinomycetota bacterium]
MSTRSRTIKETEIGDSQLRLLPGGSTAPV